MSLKKIGNWIRLQNYNTGLKIIKRYYPETELEKKSSIISISFLLLYLKRLFYVLIYLPFANAETFSKYFQSKSLKEFLMRLLGFYKTQPVNSKLDNKYSVLNFSKSSKPLVSIVINTSGNGLYTYNCLRSVLKNTTTVAYEIIVLNHNNTDFSYQKFVDNAVTQITDLKEDNVTKLQNLASEIANGDFLCFLNSEVIPNEKWLENLLAVFNYDQESGVVAPKLIYPYGLLKAAGSVINEVGKQTNIGEFQEVDQFEYNFIKEIDYCNSAGLLVKKADFIGTGKFNPDIKNADYVFADFCYRLKSQLDKKIYYQPLSSYVDFRLNKEVADPTFFVDIWRDTLAKPKAKDKKESILIIDAVIPKPDQDSGSRRIFEIVKLFQALNLNTYFLAHKGLREEPYYSSLVNIGARVICQKHIKEKMVKKLPSILPFIDFVWISRLDINSIYGPVIKSIKSVPWLNDTVDLHFIRIRRELELAGMDLSKIEEKINPIRTLELKLAKLADYTITVTEVEREVLMEKGIDKVVVIPNIHEDQISDSKNLKFDQRKNIIFIGSYKHEPNIDAALWLANEIMPEVWKTDPTIKLILLGSNPSTEVVALKSDRIEVPGFIHDVSPFFLQARVFVAPLRFGAGMKGKIGQSLEFGLPIVSTYIGIEGMDLENEKDVLVAENTNEFAEHILRLYQTPELWNKIHINSIQAIEEYKPKSVLKKLQLLLNALNS